MSPKTGSPTLSVLYIHRMNSLPDTLPQVLTELAGSARANLSVTHLNGDDDETEVTYGMLYERALRVRESALL